jgi:hypothetical protein
MTQQCLLWQELTHSPSPGVVARARAAPDLLEHVEACPHCDELNPDNPAGVAAAYEVLAGKDGAAVVEDDDAFKLDASVAADVIHAVRQLLLPQLPTRLLAQATWVELELYRGLDAIAMLAERESRDRAPRVVQLSSQQGLLAGDQCLARTELIKEIRIMTGINDVNAGSMFDWLIEAARSFPPLFPGAVASPYGAADVWLQVQPRLQLDVDLSVQWAPARESGVMDVVSGAHVPSSRPRASAGRSSRNL